MLTKREIAEVIILQKSGGRPSSENNIDERDVFAVIDQIVAQVISADIEDQLRGKRVYSIDSTWTKTFPSVVIQYDKTIGTCYIDLPASRIAASNDRDICMVTWPQSQSSPFPMMAQSSQSAWGNLESAFYQEGVYSFYPDGERLIFNSMPRRFKGKKILVTMVAGVDGYGPDETLPIPEKFAQDVIERASNFFNQQVVSKSKVTNDTNVNTK